MIYRTNLKNGDRLSQLGYGCMRFPRKGGSIDMEKTTKLVRAAVSAGVNYFDTAYIYPGSEQALGVILEKEGLRDKVKIATKLPILLCKSPESFDKYFDKQLERLKTDRIDYYLMHMLTDVKAWERLKAIGALEWIKKKKADGKILNIGFSFHGGRQSFRELVDDYDWDFCMIQYNYVDEFNQAGRDGLLYASQKGMPVFIMEPLRGGMLVNGLPAGAKSVFKKANGERSLAGWALKWIWNQSEATLLLSGMSNMAQLKENITVARATKPGSLTEDERKAYAEAVRHINKKIKIPCTGCAYCMPCPRGVDIPTCFSSYNESYAGRYSEGFKHYFMNTGMMSARQAHAGNCVKCRACEKHCPQSIEISKRLPEVDRRFGGAFATGIFNIVRKIMKLN